MKRFELFFFILILTTAIFFRSYHIHSYPVGLTPHDIRLGPWLPSRTLALPFLPAIAGVLTVIGLYYLARLLFNWPIAVCASFILASNFWHVVFSRTGTPELFGGLLLVWGIYCFWKGIASSEYRYFVWAGIIAGLGFYTGFGFWVTPGIIIVALIGYWQALGKDFEHEKYAHTRNKLAWGIQIAVFMTIIVILPLGYYFHVHPDQFLAMPKLSWHTLGHNILATLGMFAFTGDHNALHNIPGQSLVYWALTPFFAAGFLRSWIKLFKQQRTHGHLSPAYLILLTWFFLGLIPAILSPSAPDAQAILLLAPLIALFTGQGLWWLFETLEHWYHLRDRHEISITNHYHKKITLAESSIASALVFSIFLGTIAFAQFDMYFHHWQPHQSTNTK